MMGKMYAELAYQFIYERDLRAMARGFERDNYVTSEIQQSDWTVPNRSLKAPDPLSLVRGRGLETISAHNIYVRVCI